jgi:biopolymer transport protein ExbB
MLELLRQGGIVMGLILASGLAAFLVFWERVLHLHRARIRSEDFLQGIRNNLSRGNVQEAVAICDETPGPVAYLVKTAILHRSGGKESIRTAMDNAGRSEISRMERRLVVLATVAQTAPLLGLLGTVVGMIRAALVMQQKGPLVQQSDLMGGLLQALVTTAAGLTVAIPCYIAFNFLVGRVEKIVLDMERAASDILGFLTSGTALNERDGEAGARPGQP